MPKIIALPEHGVALLAGQRVGEAVAEVEVGRVAAAFAVVAVGLPCNFCLRRGYRFDLESGIFKYFFQPGHENRVLVPAHNNPRLKVGCSGEANHFRRLNRIGEGLRFRFIFENCDQG
jgi:hypothetical protein